jgi:Flp pilus assembly protein TadD
VALQYLENAMNCARICTVLSLWCLPAVILCGCQTSSQSHSSDMLQTEQKPGKMTKQQAADMHMLVGRSHEAQGQVPQAITAYQAAIKNDPRRADAHLRLAILHDIQAKFQESERFYAKALKLSPGNAEIYCDKGYSLYLQRRWSDAEMNLRQALAIQHNHERAHNNLGLVLAHTDRFDEALAEFQQGGSNHAEARANLAFCQTLDRRWDEARENYQIALAEDPSSETVKSGLRQLDHVIAKSKPTPQPVAASLNQIQVVTHEQPEQPKTAEQPQASSEMLILTEIR